MLALEISASLLSLITFVVMAGLSVLGYLSLRRHIRRIDLPDDGDTASTPSSPV